MIRLETNLGNIELTLDHDKAPITAANFEKYVGSGFYDGTIFHRVINHFMVQGGGFTEQMAQKPTQDPIQNEANNGLANEIGSIAMARTSDPHSATAQFFINVSKNDFLNFKRESADGWGYCVFGQVTAGMDVVEQIKAVETTSKAGHQDVPVDAIIIKKAYIVS